MREAETPLAEGVACERTYQAVFGGEPKPFLCRWFVPEPHPEGGWMCRLEITWPDGQMQTRSIGGVDSTQALMLALGSVAADILVSDASIYWFDAHDDLGLPAPSGLADDIAARKARFEAKS